MIGRFIMATLEVLFSQEFLELYLIIFIIAVIA